MALQIEVTSVSVQIGDGNLGPTVTLNLTCWPEGVVKEYPVRNADGTVDMKNAVIFQDFSEYVKSNVEGQSLTDRVNEVIAKFENVMQDAIDKYKGGKSLLNGALLEQVRADIEAALEG